MSNKKIIIIIITKANLKRLSLLLLLMDYSLQRSNGLGIVALQKKQKFVSLLAF